MNSYLMKVLILVDVVKITAHVPALIRSLVTRRTRKNVLIDRSRRLMRAVGLITAARRCCDFRELSASRVSTLTIDAFRLAQALFWLRRRRCYCHAAHTTVYLHFVDHVELALQLQLTPEIEVIAAYDGFA